MEHTTEFTPWASLGGGVLIGLSACLLMALHGRIAGISGIVSGLVPPLAQGVAWRFAFILGAITAPVIYGAFGGLVPFAVPPKTLALAVGGLIVGGGVYLGSGCTSGHGICGLARFSPRSLAATIVFMLTAFVTVYVTRHLLGI